MFFVPAPTTMLGGGTIITTRHRMKIITTGDGSNTLEHDTIGELYHSDRGAVGESIHVFIGNGLLASDKKAITVFEVGFGTGLNCLLSLEAAQRHNLAISYHAIELYPITAETAKELNYTTDERFIELHTTPWGEQQWITPFFSLTKHRCSLTEFDFSPFREHFDVIYHDAFAPDIQPEMWSEAVFKSLYQASAPNAIITTYTAKGDVRRAMSSAGYRVEKLAGALGKRHQLRGVK